MNIFLWLQNICQFSNFVEFKIVFTFQEMEPKGFLLLINRQIGVVDFFVLSNGLCGTAMPITEGANGEEVVKLRHSHPTQTFLQYNIIGFMTMILVIE